MSKKTALDRKAEDAVIDRILAQMDKESDDKKKKKKKKSDEDED